MKPKRLWRAGDLLNVLYIWAWVGLGITCVYGIWSEEYLVAILAVVGAILFVVISFLLALWTEG